jgi:hypothetical protein
MSTREAFRSAVADLAAKAAETLPAESAGRVEAAVKIVLAGDVTLLPDGTATVASGSDPAKSYTVNGVCSCQDYERAPAHWCKHRISRGMLIRLGRLQPTEEPTPEEIPPMPEPDAAESAARSIDPRWLCVIKGKPFVRYEGLLAMAHERGLQGLKADWTYNDAEVSLAHAVAVFPFGTYEESGDSSPSNVGAQVRPHWRRMALVRAKARCLRDALNIGVCSLAEIGEQEAPSDADQ